MMLKSLYTLTAQDKDGVLIEGYIRKLTPVECERLQTVPVGYTSGVSNTQRYKMLGNGWTVEVIKHIFSFIGAQDAK
jgi:site-specific DNA-cytosine methylase